ncbi:15-hydroxyprostaglandin dehydrogenase [NAD(+)]-like [Ischnura elegans]|uniref:15-hydroxyprostaglandin dehydrogenase [NAD(+)]-like n=1 Tax=Ischnura elegans TaxID=197161 RepID=UPI001ED8780C|nr:15-hydroxyprostaglandin dehydrogenase [NAD(+)]-like [Ischnura elegans]
MELEGSVALVTGGVGGLGRSITRNLLQCGVSVVIFDLNKENGNAFQKKLEKEFGEGRAHFIRGDVTKKEDMEGAFKETVDKYSRVDIMINNAGIMNDEHWEAEIDINLKALVRGTNEAIKYMDKQKGGNGGIIVNMSSVLGLVPLQLTPVYTATKFAVIGFTRAHGYQNQYNKTGVRVVTLCPGHTETELVTKGPFGKVLQKFLSQHHKGDKEHLAQQPEAVGAAVPIILKNAPTGSIWVVEGGAEPYQISIPHYRDFKIDG